MGFGFRDSRFGIRDSGFGIRDSGFGFRVCGNAILGTLVVHSKSRLQYLQALTLRALLPEAGPSWTRSSQGGRFDKVSKATAASEKAGRNTRQSRPDSGLDLQVRVHDMFQVVPFPLGGGEAAGDARVLLDRLRGPDHPTAIPRGPPGAVDGRGERKWIKAMLWSWLVCS